MASLSLVFIVLALITFVIGAANPPIGGGRVNFVSLGLAFAALAWLFMRG